MSYKDRVNLQENRKEEKTGSVEKRVMEPRPIEGIITNSKYVCLRKEPLKGCNIGTVVREGTRVLIVGEVSGYLKVRYQDPKNKKSDAMDYYVSKAFCEVIGNFGGN